MIAAISEDGELSFVDVEPTHQAITAIVGEPGFDIVRLAPGGRHPSVVGYVNDESLISGRYRLNIAGSVLLMMLGASQRQPYHGPVVISGFDVDHYPTEAVRLSVGQRSAIKQIHGDVRYALGTEPRVVNPATSSAAIRELARRVALMEIPGIAVLTGDDALRALGLRPAAPTDEPTEGQP